MSTTTPLRLDRDCIQQPVKRINPTKAVFKHIDNEAQTEYYDDDDNASDEKRNTAPHKHIRGQQYQPASSVKYKWTSRNNRKGRHALVIEPKDAASSTYEVPPYSDNFREVLKTVWLMLTHYPVWDISWLVAFIFTVGSAVWCINGFFAFLPELYYGDWSNLQLYGGGITAFIGATLFEIGSVFLLLEAINTDKSGCFGWALEKAIHGESGHEVIRAVPRNDLCTHHHSTKAGLIRRPTSHTSASSEDGMSWTWWPTDEELRTHWSKDIGFWASFIQFWAATIFWIAGFTALPGIYDHLAPATEVGVYWVPQVVASVGFVFSGFMFMIETQDKWWKPAPRILGWYIGLLNGIGGIGFLLCGCFGLASAEWAVYQSSCSTFWGSWAFLLGSAIQWYESMNKHPVEKAE